jgi:hypothetical protein
MRTLRRAKCHIIGPAAGLLLGWLLPTLLGPPIAAWGPSLRDYPRLSDAVVGAGGMLVYLSEAPGMYLAEHLTRAIPAEAAVNAAAWALIGLTIAGFVMTIRRGNPLAAGTLGGLLLGWMLPALSRTLGECFRHCWMHEGFLGDLALAGGTALRAVGVLAEFPWRLLAGPPDGVTPVLAMPVSALLWALIGTGAVAVVTAARRSIFPQRCDDEGCIEV